MLRTRALGAAALALLALAVPAGAKTERAATRAAAAAPAADPVTLTIGYQPYYAESWSGLIMRKKAFWKKYLPKGSKVNWEIGLQGSIIVSAMLAGKEQIGYMGDMPAIVGASKRPIRDLRIVGTLGVSQDQCAVFLTRPDAPKFATQKDAISWMAGKTVAVPQGSCTDRIAQATFQRIGIAPGQYLNQSLDVITSSFQSHKIDAAVVWEPTASRLVNQGLAKRVASGSLVTQTDTGFLVMDHQLLQDRPDVAEGWLKAELDAQKFLSDPRNAKAIAAMADEQTDGFDPQDLWDALYRRWPVEQGGSKNGLRLRFPFALTPDVRLHIANATTFLHRIKAINNVDQLPAGAIDGTLAAKVFKASGLKGQVGVIKALERQPGSDT